MKQEAGPLNDDVDFKVTKRERDLYARKEGWVRVLLALVVAMAIILGIIVGVQQSQIGGLQTKLDAARDAADTAQKNCENEKKLLTEECPKTTPTGGAPHKKAKTGATEQPQ